MKISELAPLVRSTLRNPGRDPYQSIDLIEYYKSYDRHKELGRVKQALEGAKVNMFSIFYNFKGNFSDLFFTSEMKKGLFQTDSLNN